MESLNNGKMFYKLNKDLKKYLIYVVIVGTLISMLSLFHTPVRFWVNFLINNFYFICMALSGLFFLVLQNITGSSWMRTYQRVPEAMTKFLPFSLVLMFLGYFGLHTIYEWTHHDVMMNDPILVKKIAYLNTPFFFIRMVLFFLIWIGFSKLISYLMDRWDKTKYLEQDSRIAMYSAITLVVFSLTFAFASYDWIMSIEPHWFSTIFSIYTFSGLFVGGVAFITLALIVLRMQGYLTEYVTNDHLHDLGKWMFGMSTFWAYIWFCQYMLIWYSNIPEETEYYILRSQGNWTWLFWSNFAISFGVPFIFLMTRESKRNPVTLAIVAVVILIGRWVDLYTLVAPKVYEHNEIAAIIGPYEIVSAISYAAFFLLIFSYYLSKKKLIIENDPYFEEGLHLHQ